MYLEDRRNALFEKLDDNSVAVIYAGTSKIATEDELYPFVCNNNFFYLTDIKQENSIILFVKSTSGNFTYLFVDEYSELKEKWTGKRLTYDEAKEISHIDNVLATSNFEAIFALCFAKENNQYGNIKKCYIDEALELKILDKEYIENTKEKYSYEYSDVEFVNLRPILSELRKVKQDEEIEFIKEAINHTHHGILDLISNFKAGQYEYAVRDRFEYYEKTHYREGLAFSTIIASGKNACCLHYPQQLCQIGPNDLVLCDLGYKYHGYSADITRTYPVNGKFNELQAKVYTAVLNCNKAVIDYARSGLYIKDLQEFAINVLKNECIRLELMDPNDDIKNYYYHNVSHYLGLDTHDVGSREIPLAPGNVITVEPGLYFAKYGIGVRIEDDVLITDDKSIVLSKDIKKEIADIEKLLGAK